MKMWNIETNDASYAIEVDDLTILKKQDISWYYLVRKINSFFNEKSADVQIYEDTQPINKKDWSCTFIPFDAHVQIDKITTKSPLKSIQYHAAEQLTYSPFYNELQDIWEQLDEELELVNQKFKKWGITSHLKMIDTKSMLDFIQFTSDHEMSPLEYKLLLLNLLFNSEMDKNMLVIIEFPEFYADTNQLSKFRKKLNEALLKGFHFILVSDKEYSGSINRIYQKMIINDAKLEQMKFKVMKELPFYCTEEFYEEGKNLLFRLVDNSLEFQELMTNEEKNLSALVTIIHLMLYNLNVEFMHDLEGIEPNLRKFIQSYK